MLGRDPVCSTIQKINTTALFYVNFAVDSIGKQSYSYTWIHENHGMLLIPYGFLHSGKCVCFFFKQKPRTQICLMLVKAKWFILLFVTKEWFVENDTFGWLCNAFCDLIILKTPSSEEFSVSFVIVVKLIERKLFSFFYVS